MKKIILLFILFIGLTNTYSQNTLKCNGAGIDTGNLIASLPPNCGLQSLAYKNKYRLQSTYIPTPSDPVITLKLVLHILTKSDGTSFGPGWHAVNDNSPGNYNMLLNSDHMGAITNGNTERFGSGRSANYLSNFNENDSVTFNRDTRVQYEIDTIYYYKNTSLFTLCSSPNVVANTSNFINYIITNNSESLYRGLPILLNPYLNHAQDVIFNLTPYGTVKFVSSSISSDDPPFFRSGLRHEIDHCLGFLHNYYESCCHESIDTSSVDFLDDVFPINDGGCSNHFLYYNNNFVPPIAVFYTLNNYGTCHERPLTYSITPGGLTLPKKNSNNIMSENHSGLRWHSPLQMGRRYRNLHINTYTERFANIRHWVKDRISQHTNPWEIAQNETWDFDIQLYKDMVVKSGNTLKVTCKINMAREGRIIVEKGAKLVVDGGEITTWSKTNSWEGIYIEGSGNGTPQNLSFQGQVEVINGGTITNAQVAINTFIKDASGNVNWATTGGMIFCDNANFINNIKDVQFMYYHGLAINNNVCTFKNTNFKITGALKGGALPDSRVSMYEVNGVTFLGCNFENTTGSNLASQNWGINSIDARYTIDKLGVTPTTIKGFATGIRVENTNPLKLITVKNTNFEDNLDNGIYINNTNNIILENNSFKMPSQVSTNPNPTPVFSNGVYLNNSKYYNVRNNNFTRNLALPLVYQNVGITAHNSQNGEHHIYNNKYNSLDIGVLALANNSGLTNSTDGLLMNCNDFTGLTNVYDIAIVEDQINGNNNSTFASVKVTQGLPGNIADQYVRNRYGATFIASNSETQFYIANVGKSYLHGTNPDAFCLPLPQPQFSDPLLNVVAGTIPFNVNQCPADQFASSNPCTACPIIVNLNSAISESQANYNAVLSNYTTFIDGGNTTTLVAAVNSNMSNGNLKNLLESKSPYLSDAVLNAYFNRPTTPPGHIKDIHAQNAPVSNEVWQTIQGINLPPGIRNQINTKQNENKFSSRDLLYAQISQAHTRLQGSVSSKINYFATDTLTSSADSLIQTLTINRGNMDNAKEQLFFAHLNKEDYVNAEKTALDIELNQNAVLGGYLKKLISLHTNPRKVDGILGTESNIAFFNAIAQNKEIFASAGAKSLLKSFKGVSYFEPRFLPQSSGNASRLSQNPLNENEEPIHAVSVYPNPTNGSLILVKTEIHENADLLIIITDAIGRKVAEKRFNNNQSCELNLKDLQGGIYLLNVYNADKLIQISKVVKLD